MVWPCACACLPVQVDNPLLVRLCEELREEAAPKVTVKSAGPFEGKVWE